MFAAPHLTIANLLFFQFRELMTLWNDVMTCHHGYLHHALDNARCNWDDKEESQGLNFLIPSTIDLVCRLKVPVTPSSLITAPSGAQRRSTSSTPMTSRDDVYLRPANIFTRHLHNYIIYVRYKQTLYRLQAMVRVALNSDAC